MSAADYLPARKTLPVLRAAVQKCEGCDLYRYATQAVFGAGPAASRIVFIGEQPGDAEDKAGQPFVGPAGRLLERAFQEAGIDRSGVYLTNAVRHFKFEERGKRRLHKKPGAGEVKACNPWLEAEIAVIHPEILVCLGATAALSVFGNAYRVTRERGKFVPHIWAPHATSTVHPSSILRAPDEQRQVEYRRFVEDLVTIREFRPSRATS